MTGKTDRENAEQVRQIRRFWRHLFGSQSGYLCVATADRDGKDCTNWAHEYFRNPQDTQAAAIFALEQANANKEVYQVAHLLQTPGNPKGENAASILCLYGDLDGARVPEKPKPTALVESSPGHWHPYWRLSVPLDPQQAKDLNRRLSRMIGGDNKWHLGAKLRVPSTTNNKRGEPTLVALVRLTVVGNGRRQNSRHCYRQRM